jgi:hypothetical protein
MWRTLVAVHAGQSITRAKAGHRFNCCFESRTWLIGAMRRWTFAGGPKYISFVRPSRRLPRNPLQFNGLRVQAVDGFFYTGVASGRHGRRFKVASMEFVAIRA